MGIMDGHAEWISHQEYGVLMLQTFRNPLWCNPADPNARKAGTSEMGDAIAAAL